MGTQKPATETAGASESTAPTPQALLHVAACPVTRDRAGPAESLRAGLADGHGAVGAWAGGALRARSAGRVSCLDRFNAMMKRHGKCPAGPALPERSHSSPCRPAAAAPVPMVNWSSGRVVKFKWSNHELVKGLWSKGAPPGFGWRALAERGGVGG